MEENTKNENRGFDEIWTKLPHISLYQEWGTTGFFWETLEN